MPKRKKTITAGAILLLCLSLVYFWQQTRNQSGTFEADLATLTAGGVSTVPNATMDRMTSRVRTAVTKGDYDQALKIVDALSKVNGMTPEQTVSLRNTVQSMKVQMAEAALGGDTNAEKAIAYFKANSVLGR